MNNKNNKVIAGLTAAILGLAVVGGTSLAVADEAPTVGSLTIHKIAKTTSNGTEAGTGKEATVAGDAINGVTFTIKKVNEVDLSTNEGWSDAAKIIKNNPTANYGLTSGSESEEYVASTLDKPVPLKNKYNSADNPTKKLSDKFSFAEAKTATTANDDLGNGGLAKFSKLPLGLYQVSETETPAGVQAARNFWVTIPMSDPVNKGQFMYDVHVYPKNTQYQLDKIVVDKDTKAVGEDVVYTLSTAISTQTTSSYVLQDQLDAAKLTFKSAEVKLGETVLAQGADADYTLTSDNNLVKVELTKKGRDAVVTHANSNVKINKKNAEKSESEKIPLDKLVLNITATVKATGEINNTGELLVDNGKVDITSNEVSSKFGAVKIMKKDSATQAGIPGVKFEVYASHTNDFKTAQKVSVDGVDSWTTGNDGGLTIDGLRYSNWADGAAVTDSDSSKYLHYWLKEVEPAEGYNTLAQPVHFTVEKQKAEAEVETAVMNIENTKVSNTSNLPLTGAYGAAALMIGGLLMVAGATVWYGRRRSVKA